jgi:hypothetical protein
MLLHVFQTKMSTYNLSYLSWQTKPDLSNLQLPETTTTLTLALALAQVLVFWSSFGRP